MVAQPDNYNEFVHEAQAFRDHFMQFTQISPDFYEPLSVYAPSQQLYNLVSELVPVGWRLLRAGVWTEVLPPMLIAKMQGWKVHISARPDNGLDILKTVVPILVQDDIHFKFACDLQMLQLMSGKNYPRAQSGKFITIYPSDDIQLRSLCDKLTESLDGHEGPYILSDMRYPGSKTVHVRYGGFTHLSRVQANGSTQACLVDPLGMFCDDLRLPTFEPPEWATIPWVPEVESADGADLPTLKDGRYLITEALHFSNTGGVYSAIDLENDRDVIIKEARPHTGSMGLGWDAVKFRQHEWAILQKLQHLDCVPKALDDFWDWEHYFIVVSPALGLTLEKIAPQLDPKKDINPSPEALGDYYGQVISVAIALVSAVEEIHSNDIVIGDLSKANVMVHLESGTVTILDFEGAVPNGETNIPSLWTNGFAPSDRGDRVSPTFDDDKFGLGCLIMALIRDVSVLNKFDPNKHIAELTAFREDYAVPNCLVDSIEQLMDPDPQRRASLDRVRSVLSGHRQIRLQPIRIEPQMHPDEVSGRIPSIVQFIMSVADTKRNDRLFPADPRLPNPLNTGYGALGVLRAIKRLDGDIPQEFLNWVRQRLPKTADYPPGLFHGMSGVAWSLDELGFHDEAITIFDAAATHPLLFTEANICDGCAGVGLASLYFWNATARDNYLDLAVHCGEWLIKTGERVEQGTYWPDSANRVRFGYGLGSSGVSLFLLHLFVATGNDRYLETGRLALDFDLAQGVAQDDASGALSFPRDPLTQIYSPYWFVGTAGVGTTLIRYASLLRDEDYAALLGRLIPDTSRKYVATPGLFFGLAGLGNFLLDCYEFSGSEHLLDKARVVADGVFLHSIERPTGLAFPGDQLMRLSTDFGTGSAGVALFLNRLVRGGKNFNFMLDELVEWPSVSLIDTQLPSPISSASIS